MAVSFEQNRLTIDSGTIELEKSIQYVKEQPGRAAAGYRMRPNFHPQQLGALHPGKDVGLIAMHADIGVPATRRPLTQF